MMKAKRVTKGKKGKKAKRVNAFGNCDSSSLPEVLGSVTGYTEAPISAKEPTE